MKVDARTGLRQFRWLGENPEPPGNWFTSNVTPAAQLGIASGQSAAHHWRLTRSFTALGNTASDAFSGWNRVTPPTASHPFADYRRGGGRQWFIPPSDVRVGCNGSDPQRPC